jgi:hypothetical protein
MTTPDETRSFDKGRVDIARVRMDDGTEVEFGPGDVGYLPLGHNATALCSGRLHRHGDIRQKMINQIHLYNVACGRT